MTIELVFALLVMVIGLVGSVLPLLPGPPIIWLGAFFYAWRTDFQSVGWGTLAVLGVLAIVAATSDIWVGVFGQKGSGESFLATALSVIGGIVGLIVLNIPGMLLGSILGILLPNWRRIREQGYVFNVSWRTIKTWLLSILIQGGLGLVMIVLFLIQAL